MGVGSYLYSRVRTIVKLALRHSSIPIFQPRKAPFSFQVKWWDIRKFTEPTEVLILDPSKEGSAEISTAHGVSCLEFEPTIPTKFMVGTDRGETLSQPPERTYSLAF